MTEVHVLRVFTDADGNFGNPLGIVLHAARVSDRERQAIATRLGYPETVFVDDVEQARLSIFTPALELRLAGHPLVGTSWLLGQVSGQPLTTLRPRLAKPVDTWVSEGGVSWIRARVADVPPIDLVQLATPQEVDALQVPPGPQYVHHEFWSWIDRAAGEVRARFFAPAFGIPEDEATGGAALVLATFLATEITIHQGEGSIIHARPSGNGRAEIGGRVVSDGVRVINGRVTVD